MKYAVIFEFHNEPSPNEGEHPKYLLQSFLNQKIGNNPVSFTVVGSVKTEKEYDDGDVTLVVKR